MANKALPTFEQAGRLATSLGLKTAEAWAQWCAGKTREDVFQVTLSVMNARIIKTPLEA